MPILPLPLLARADPDFKTKVDDFFATQLPQFSAEAEAARQEISMSVGDAADSAAAAAASYDAFDNRFLGVKGADPAVDNNGNAIQTGALYFNIATGKMRVYTGAAWDTGYTTVAGSVSDAINTAPAKVIPADVDKFCIADSAASFSIKSLTWANIKTALSSLFVAKTGAQVMAGDLTVPSINGSQISGLRNVIINGAMTVVERGFSFANPASGTYTIDRWKWEGVNTAAVTVSQQTDVPAAAPGLRASLRVTVNTADTSIATGEFAMLSQAIEGYNVRVLAAGPSVLSFWVRSSKTGPHSAAFTSATVNRSVPFSYTISAANTWEFKQITLNGTTFFGAGTHDFNNGAGLQVRFALAAGSSFVGSSGTYTLTNLVAANGQVNCLDTVGNVFAITGVQLEPGTVATPFEHRPYGLELSLCQRYYENVFGIVTGYGNATNSARMNYPYKAQKRVSPTVAISASGVSVTNAAGASYTATIGVNYGNESGALVDVQVPGTPLVVGQGCTLTMIGTTINANAEL